MLCTRRFRGGTEMYKRRFPISGTDDISMSSFNYEIVGNRFDNPELLEV